MSWDWDKLKSQQKKPEKEPEMPRPAGRTLMIAAAVVLLFIGFLGMLMLSSAPVNTDTISLINGIIETNTEIIRDLAIANQDNQRTHEILKRYGLRLGENNELYIEDPEKLRQRRSMYDH